MAEKSQAMAVHPEINARQLDLDVLQLTTLLAIIDQTVTIRRVKDVHSIIPVWLTLSATRSATVL